MEREQPLAGVIRFPGHRLGTIEETMAGLRGPATPEASRREGRVTVLEADIRGFARVADAVGRSDAERQLREVFDQALRAVTALGPRTVSAASEPTGPVISATFEGPDHCGRALEAATALRDAVDAMRSPRQPGFEACAGIDSGDEVEASSPGIAFRSVGTVRMFAARLREFAGPGQVFLSDDARSELAGRALVRSIGLVRTNAGGETREAFCLLDAAADRAPRTRAIPG
jgi:class 3 adenylate cyclase